MLNPLRVVSLLLLFLFAPTSCHTVGPQVLHVIEDCITQERPAITDLVKKWIDSAPSLADVEAQALAAGVHVGGCALHEFVNTKLTPTDNNHAPSPEEGLALRGLVTKYRADAKIDPKTVFKTPQGNLGAN